MDRYTCICQSLFICNYIYVSLPILEHSQILQEAKVTTFR